ncbi:hypothetical protein CYMTET_29138 [Cymbomonas tetramitiformis]|uniref:Protein kinase domain-containing protein n=1 Tax=Cymbomonas tetramitiformis TaxID=36881 RepID=A0AAE0FLK7_9CHLO|nr:hypothetical protein CYMTET_29138 [Cymbomonas tetramitiformis]
MTCHPTIEKRYLECARELYMTTSAWRAAPEYVVPPHNYGIVTRPGHRPTPYLLFMDHGISLDAFLQKPTCPLDMACKREICLRMVRGLRALHSGGVAHGDLRAHNLVLSPSRLGSLVFIDFGLA